MDSPYLRADQGSFELGRIPVNVLQKPLQQVMKEFIAMQSQRKCVFVCVDTER